MSTRARYRPWFWEAPRELPKFYARCVLIKYLPQKTLILKCGCYVEDRHGLGHSAVHIFAGCREHTYLEEVPSYSLEDLASYSISNYPTHGESK